MGNFLPDYSAFQWSVLILSALLIGINKTAIPGIGVLPVILLSLIFGAAASTGIQLVMLAAADVIAVCYYRRKADWHILLRLLPWAYGGIAIGVVTLHYVPGPGMKPLLAWIIIVLAILGFIRNRLSNESIPATWQVSAVCGLLLGFTTQVANAAGPVAAVYFLAMKLPKEKYMGCCSWFFLILNWTKLPIFICEGRITLDSFITDLYMLPVLLIGGTAGVLLLKNMSQKKFELIVQILILFGAVWMLVK